MLTQSIINIIASIGPIFCVILCSILPILETKIAIPLGIDYSVFKDNCLSLFQSFFIAFVSSSIMSILLAIFFYFIFKRKKKPQKLTTKLQKIFSKQISKLQNMSKPKKIVMCLLFVFLPVPFSGIYGGAILCTLLKLNLFESSLSLVIGNFLSCIVEALACYVLKPYISLCLNILIIIIILMLVYQIISFIFEKFTKITPKITK